MDIDAQMWNLWRRGSQTAFHHSRRQVRYGRYNRILVLDPGINPLSDEEILEFFDLTQVPAEIEPLELDHFQRLLTEMI